MMKARGVTLLELIIAMALVAIAFTGIYQTFSAWLAASLDTESYEIALHLARGKVEELGARSFSNVGSEARATVPTFPRFEREVRVTSLTGIKTIEVEVFWQTRNINSSYRLHTERADL